MKTNPNTPIQFSCGAKMKNKFMLAPLTNTQSFENGQLSDDEYNWLTMRAKGQFGMVTTCASHVQENGKGFPGQLGIFSDEQTPGHIKLAKSIKSHGSLAVIQLHHAGMRSPSELIYEQPVCPSNNEKHNARELSLNEIKDLKNNFIKAAGRAKKCGYDGVEIHGAHGYILTQFLSSEINKRTDEYGGSLDNRSRLLFEIVNEIRNICGVDFLIGVRLSPEKFGMDFLEIREICKRLISDNKIDFIDLSLWDVFKYPEHEAFQNKTLLEHFTELDYKSVLLTVAGKINNGKDVTSVLNAGVDFVCIGRSGILHHDFPEKVIKNPNFTPIKTPVSKEYLASEGLSNKFIDYMRRWPHFVKEQ
ncbi:NADH:flavin oxidoreductase [Tenacibaculum sediminilitoris]|uniref:NADH:flavin oxidoreductase n=1 Tax=Tenacibaculum sediminilitoris TaxID=1820334 RepID=UPI003894047B